MKGTNSKKATVNQGTKVSKEETVMKKNEVAVVEKKEVQAVETKKEVAPKTKKAVENAAKKDAFLTIEEIVKLYQEAGIKCANPEVKGNYRIMGSKKGSSLNLKPTKGYFIYSTEEDYKAIKNAGLKFEDLVVEEGTNSQDKSRPHTVICKQLATLKAVLAVYAKNPMNKVA